MSRNKKLRQKINAFISQLTPDEIREQLVLAYMQMERCNRVLRGEDVEPVEMKDNGLSSDLELFYACKKNAEELAYLNEVASQPERKHNLTGERQRLSDAVDMFKQMADALKNFGKNQIRIKMRYVPKAKAIEFSGFEDLESFAIDVKALQDFINRETGGESKIEVGKTFVYFLYQGKIHKNVIKEVMGLQEGEGIPIVRIPGYTGVFRIDQISDNPNGLLIDIHVQNHISYNEKVQEAYFIDNTNRVFRAAEWYLAEQNILHFKTLDELRKYLISNIVDDGAGKH